MKKFSHEELMAAAEQLAHGQKGDTILARINAKEARALMQAGGAGKADKYGIMQFYPDDGSNIDTTDAVDSMASSIDATDGSGAAESQGPGANNPNFANEFASSKSEMDKFNARNSNLGMDLIQGMDTGGKMDLQLEMNPISLLAGMIGGPTTGAAVNHLLQNTGLANDFKLNLGEQAAGLASAMSDFKHKNDTSDASAQMSEQKTGIAGILGHFTDRSNGNKKSGGSTAAHSAAKSYATSEAASGIASLFA